VLAHVAAVGKSTEGWRKVIDADLTAVHLMTQAIAPHMVRGGVAILISSTGSYLCPPGNRIDALLDEPLKTTLCDDLVSELDHEPSEFEAYCLAKQGVNRLAEKLAIAWGEKEVRAVSVSVGMIDSTMGRTSGAMLPRQNAPGSEKGRSE
jgi:NAD(P)-dependent dehydrogenase (short-subunit alcohol dehydrogenase family)